jgi:hypothetical protein
VAIPNGGPVISDPVTQGVNAQSQPYPQLIPKPPAPGGSPQDIVRGFLTASASFADGKQVARDFLTPAASRAWKPNWSGTVFKGNGPQVGHLAYPVARNRSTVTVSVSGKVQAELSAYGAYAVPSASGGNVTSATFTLVRTAGQWRISRLPSDQLLLTGTEFAADYQLRNLYFLDPDSRFLVPDPVYVPQQTTPSNLLTGLVHDLIGHPGDWLRDGTLTAFPSGATLLGDVTVNGGVAEVNLGGAAASSSDRQRELMSAQLLSTLSGSGQGQPLVQSVELNVNGKPWSPPQAQQNPVQHTAVLGVPDGSDSAFYYLDSQGSLMREPGAGRSPVKVRALGTGYSAIAVSRDGRYLAALRAGTLYTGPVGGTLLRRGGSDYTTMSWDAQDRLWTTESSRVAVLRGTVTAHTPAGLAAPQPVPVQQPNGLPNTLPVNAIRIAPDGVRVAFITGGLTETLAFGAISEPSVALASDRTASDQTASASDQALTASDRTASASDRTSRSGLSAAGSAATGPSWIRMSPFTVSGGSDGFASVSWYGAGDVVTIGAVPGPSGPPLTEYSVNGASSSDIPTGTEIQSITTNAGGELVAGTRNGQVLLNPGPDGAWTPLGPGMAPAYPG